MYLYETNLIQKRVILYHAYIKDGATTDVASSSADNAKRPVLILKKHFGFKDEDEITSDQLTTEILYGK
jgi:hypothetical protein